MYTILLGVPSSGMLCESASQASWQSSLHHKVHRVPSCCSGPNFNRCWMTGLNAGLTKQITHFAMMHVDIQVIESEEVYNEKLDDNGKVVLRTLDEVKSKRWLDRLVEEMDSVGADFISTPIAIKDIRGVTSCGIGDPNNRWNPWRRLTTPEFERLPTTFDLADTGYTDKFLLHNHALCLWDMRKPLWYQPDEHGRIRAIFNYTEELRLVNGEVQIFADSEDWDFSRQLWQMGAKTFITSRIEVLHHGGLSFSNKGSSCLYQKGDEDTSSNWRNDDRLPKPRIVGKTEEPLPESLLEAAVA